VALLQNLFNRITKREDLDFIYDLDLIQETSDRVYLKRMAVDAVLNFVGRSFSQSEFRVYADGKTSKSPWRYKLNVRPNTDMSATTFWQKVIYELIYENEVLIVLSDTDDLLIADYFERKEYALYPDAFEEVKVKDYTFERSFSMDEAIYMEYNNEELSKFVDGLFADYGELFGRMMNISLRNHQIRAVVDIEQTAGFSEETAERLQKYVNKLFSMFSKNSVAIVPQTKGFNYDEIADGGEKGQATSEMADIKNEFVDDVARMVGVPPKLIHGDVAELGENKEVFYQFCLEPILKKVEGELNAKLFTQKEYMDGDYIEVVGINRPNIFELAQSIDKIVSSGAFNRNEVRVKTGHEPIDTEEMNAYYITKNYERDDVEGGEDNDEEN